MQNQDKGVSGDAVLWEGVPVSYRVISKMDFLFVPGSLLWCVAALIWDIELVKFYLSGRTFSGFIFAVILGVLASALGLYLLLGRFLYTRHLLRTEKYILTERELVIKRGRKEIRINPAEYADRRVMEKKDGSGTIVFRKYHDMAYIAVGSGLESFLLPPGIYVLRNIENVQAVKQMIEFVARKNQYRARDERQ